MRTILEEQKRRLEIKIRCLQDESHASDDPSHNATSSTGGSDQSLQELPPASSDDVPAEDLRPSTQETPEAGASGVRDVCSNVAARTEEAQEMRALPVNPTTTSVASTATTAAVAASDSTQMVPVSFEQSVAMESPQPPHVSTVHGHATVAAATASASLRFLGPPPAVSVGIDPAQLQAPLAATHVSGAPFHVSAAFQHAMQSVTPTLAQDGPQHMQVVQQQQQQQHQAAMNGVWLGQTATAHGAMVTPGGSVGPNQCFLFRGNEWPAPPPPLPAASATAGRVPVGSSVEFAPPSADAGSMPPPPPQPASTLFGPSRPLAPSGWPQAVSSAPSVVSLPPPPPLPAGVEATVAGTTTESGCAGGERRANSESTGQGEMEGGSTEAEAKTVTSTPAAAATKVWQQYHDGVTREPVVGTSIVNGKRNGTHDCIRGGRGFAFIEEGDEDSGGAARCLPMLWRSARGRAGAGRNGEHVENGVVREGGNLDGDSNGTTEFGCSSGIAGGINGDVKGVEGMTPAGTPADDGQTSSEASACIPAPSTSEDSQEEHAKKTGVSALTGVEKAGSIRGVNFSTDSDKRASKVSQGEKGASPTTRAVHAAHGEDCNGGRVEGDTGSCGDGAGVGGRAEERRTVVRVGGDHKLNIGTPAMLSFR